jgi:hypothetical protein
MSEPYEEMAEATEIEVVSPDDLETVLEEQANEWAPRPDRVERFMVQPGEWELLDEDGKVILEG